MTTQPQILTVTQLNRQVRSYLEYEVGEVCVAGEISNFSKPASGHFYFTLKDATAQVKCVYFRNRHTGVARGLDNGQQVIARGKLSLYEARGDYQLIVEQLDEAGQGDLYRQFELLKVKLAALGLFDAARKKPLPRIPQCIGVITSATGAAMHDILTTLERRFPLVPVLVYASDVQGKQAAPQLIQALVRANHEKRCDVLILARGGGSIEDLWAFNDEQLAHAIFNSAIPVVSGVGHETDFTIADFVADLRAATPTAAAESVVPNKMDLIQTLDYLERHLHRAMGQLLAKQQHQLQMTVMRLQGNHPGRLVQQALMRVSTLEVSLHKLMEMKIALLRQHFMQQLATLHAVSPLATLDRGNAIATCRNTVLLESEQVRPGDVIDVRLARGSLACEVRGITPCLRN